MRSRLVLSLFACCLIPAAQAGETPAADVAQKSLIAAHGFLQAGQWEFAAQEFTTFRSNYPQHAMANAASYGLAVCLLRLGKHDQVPPLVEPLLNNPAFAERDEALVLLGHARLALKAPEAAAAAFGQVLERHAQSPHAPGAALGRCRACLQLGKRDEALAACRWLLERFPKDALVPTTLYTQAIIQREAGRHQEAVASAEAFLSRFSADPLAFDARLLLGQCQESLQQFPKAIEAYRALIANAPASRKAEGYQCLAALLIDTGSQAQALEVLRACLAELPQHALAAWATVHSGVCLLYLERHDECRRTLQEAQQRWPAMAPLATYWTARSFQAQNRIGEALPLFERLVATPPPDLPAGRLDLDRAACQVAAGKPAEAAKLLDGFATRFANSPLIGEAAYARAHALHLAADYANSMALCAAGAASQADRRAAFEELRAENLLRLGRTAEAEPVFQALANEAARGTDAAARLRLGLRLATCAQQAGRTADVVQRCQALTAGADDRDPLVQESLCRQGMALMTLNRPAEAEPVFQRLLTSTNPVVSGEGRLRLALAQEAQKRGEQALATLTPLANDDKAGLWRDQGALELGRIGLEAGKLAEAAAVLDALASRARDDLRARAFFLRGRVAAAAKDPQRATQCFDEVANRHPEHPLAIEASLAAGQALLDLNRPPESLQRLAQGLAKAKEPALRGRLRAAEARARGAARQLREAITVLVAALQEPGLPAEALYELAWVARNLAGPPAEAPRNPEAKPTPELGELRQQAEAAYRRLLAEQGKHALANPARAELAGMLSDAGRTAEALPLLEAAANDTDPGTVAVALLRRAQALRQLGKPAEAAALLATFLTRFPEHHQVPQALLHTGLARLETNDARGAVEVLAGLVQRFGQQAAGRLGQFHLGQARSRAGDHAGALEAYRTWLAAPSDPALIPEARFGAGWSCEQQRQYAEARTWYEQVVAACNTETAARAQFQIGETYFAENRLGEAQRELLKVDLVYAFPVWSARALYEAGRVQEKQGDQAAANKTYETLRNKYPQAPETALAAGRLKK